jgi:hypothetical protein
MAKKKTMYGVTRMAAFAGFACPRIILLIILNIIKDIRPPTRGDIYPILPQLTEPIPAATRPNPATAPTMEWVVVETGNPVMVAKVSQIAADNRAADMWITRSAAGSPSSIPDIKARATMPLWIVSVMC